MQGFDIVKQVEIDKKSFRVNQVIDQFGITGESIKERFTGELPLPEGWDVGVIVGKSGTGKSTICNSLFGKYITSPVYKNKSVIDDFPQDTSSEEVFNTLMSVGFASPPSWLKPYSVLSNGEKMRVDLAMALLQKKEIIVFDEYTSVVDREVAQVGSFAVQRAVRRAGKKFIAVSCHFDIIDWLEPDWVFNTDEMKFYDTRGLHRRPKINIEVFEEKGWWEVFSKHHYMINTHKNAAREFIAVYKEKPIAFVSYIHFPSAIYKTMKKGHRLVVLPDYQGLGVAKKLQTAVAKELSKDTEFVGFTTSLNGFAKSMLKEKDWTLIHTGRVSRQKNFRHMNKTDSSSRNTFSFRYVGQKAVKIG